MSAERHTIPDEPRLHRHQQEIDRKLALLDEPHIGPLTDFVRRLRAQLGEESVPWFDPTEAGINAQILLLLQSGWGEGGATDRLRLHQSPQQVRPISQMGDTSGAMHWVPDPTESSVRNAIAAAVPELADATVELAPELETTSNPEWCASTAIVGGSFVVKFAWSEVAARRVHREADVLRALADFASELPVPRLVGSSDDPVVFVTRLVDGRPLHFGSEALAAGERDSVAAQLASFLAVLHHPSVLEEVRDRVPTVVAPKPQGTTSAIRERLPRFLDQERSRLMIGWCDWVDEVLAAPSTTQSFVHGDLHGFNQVWDRGPWTLRLVADFEVAGPADPEYDLRYLPPMEPTLGLVEAVREYYEAISGRTLVMSRVMAWHIRTALGDALWRSEAGVALPGGCTPASYVDDIEQKLGVMAD